MILQTFKKSYRKVLPSHRFTLIPKMLEGCESVLDIGCGRTSPVAFCRARYTVGVDIFGPYIDKSKSENRHDDYVLSDITAVEFKPRSFDAVLCTEVLEHLPKEDGDELVGKMKRWATKRVVVTTTNGFCGNETVDDNDHQLHLSGWSVDDLESLGFKVKGIRGWIGLRPALGSRNAVVDFMAERASDLTQIITYHLPKTSHRLLAIHNINGPERPI